jgi:hypothetical protein
VRGALAVGMVAVAGLGLTASADARKFRVTGAVAHASAVEDAELAPLEEGGQNDRVHAEFDVSYHLVREAGVFKSPVLSVPSARTTRVLVKGSTRARGSGQTWRHDHYASWSCRLKPHRFKTVRDYAVVAGNTVQVQVGESFNFSVSDRYCTQSEQGALPGGLGTTAGRRLAPEMLIAHAFSASELGAGKLTVHLAQTAGGPVDCSGGEVVSCTDSATTTGTLVLRRKRG